MKKMGILASLALCVTIGGVYAAWVYADQEVKTSYATMGVTVTGVTGSSQKGVLGAVGSNVSLTIDDLSAETAAIMGKEDAGQHITQFVYDPNGYFTVTFTANANAPQDVLKNGIDLQWYVGLATTANVAVDPTTVQYNHEAIYTFTTPTATTPTTSTPVKIVKVDPENLGGVTKVEIENGVQYKKGDVVIESREEKPNGTVVFTYRVGIKDVVDQIELSEILLDTQDKHNAYSEIVNRYLFHFHVAEVVAQSESN